MALNDLPASAQHHLPPDAEGIAGVFRRVGYDLEDAIADILDNSIDAGARRVVIRFVRSSTGLIRVLILDDGCGMAAATLHSIMQYGFKGKHKTSDLGKYGIGLKAASSSQCTSLSVISRANGATSGRRWTHESVSANWTLEEIVPHASRAFYDKALAAKKSGTIIVWDGLEISLPGGLDFEKALSLLIKNLSVRLGLTFHRFLNRQKLTIVIETDTVPSGARGVPMPVQPLDPFGYSKSGRKGFPVDFVLELGKLGTLKLKAHIWPAKSNDPNYRLGGGNIAGRQGFYFYRNDRLIQAGGWNKHLKSDHEPHLSLARVSIDLPPEFDSAFRLTIQKHKFEPPRSFVDSLREARAGEMSFSEYLDAANDTYRSASKAEDFVTYYPGSGIPAPASRRIAKQLCDPNSATPTPIAFEWTQLPEHRVFELDRENLRIGLNRRYREQITEGWTSKNDAPLVKLLVFFIAENAFLQDRTSKKMSDALQRVNDALLEVVRTVR